MTLGASQLGLAELLFMLAIGITWGVFELRSLRRGRDVAKRPPPDDPTRPSS